MKRDAILDASVAILAARGLKAWTLDEVAREARCAKGLVVYHHGSKTNLLRQSAATIEADIGQARLAGLDQPDPLDGLWQSVLGGIASGRFRARTALRAAAFGTQAADHRGEPIRRAAAVALDIPFEALAAETALRAMLDGLSLQLLDGVPEESVKASYDQLWVTMIRD